jgi:hypothetical protein
MLPKYKLTVAQLLNNPNARAIFILGTLLVAALVGGAPSSPGGG